MTLAILPHLTVMWHHLGFAASRVRCCDDSVSVGTGTMFTIMALDPVYLYIYFHGLFFFKQPEISVDSRLDAVKM